MWDGVRDKDERQRCRGGLGYKEGFVHTVRKIIYSYCVEWVSHGGGGRGTGAFLLELTSQLRKQASK